MVSRCSSIHASRCAFRRSRSPVDRRRSRARKRAWLRHDAPRLPIPTRVVWPQRERAVWQRRPRATDARAAHLHHRRRARYAAGARQPGNANGLRRRKRTGRRRAADDAARRDHPMAGPRPRPARLDRHVPGERRGTRGGRRIHAARIEDERKARAPQGPDMTAVRYACCDEHRRTLLAGSTGNVSGIDYIEVHAGATTADPTTIDVVLVKPLTIPAASALNAANFSITGGVRFPPPRIATPVGMQPGGGTVARYVLTIPGSQPTDFSTYRLAIVDPPRSTTPPSFIDTRLSEVEFSFKVECPSDFDCAPECD